MQRDYSLLEATVGLCPHCLARLDAKILERGGRVFVARNCPRHGEQVDLLEEDVDYFRARNRFARPATVSPVQTAVRDGCPFDCGLCPNHEQHTCIGLIEITGACDRRCPACYADSGEGRNLSVDDFERMVDFALECEGGSLDILQLSGGEPTLHPELATLIGMARRKGVKCVLLNTNGLSLARNPALLQALAGFENGFEVYLQFDSLSEGPYRELRGEPLLDQKLEALAALSQHGIPTTLVASAAAGVNEDELGVLVTHGLRTPAVRGVSFQALAYFGRLPDRQINRLGRLTVSGILRRLEKQMKQMIRQDHLTPLPCAVDRVAIGYFHRTADGGFTPMVTRPEVLANLGQVRNTLRFSPEEFAAAAAVPGCCCGLTGQIAKFFPPTLFGSRPVRERARQVTDTTFRVTVTSFVDAYNFDLRACQRECVHVITPDLRRIPFSAFNLFHRNPRPLP